MHERRRWIRSAVGLLGVEQLVSGVWAVADPSGWFRGYPGLGRAWVAPDGPYNHHLVIDAGSGWLGVGVALLVAALWARRAAIIVALAAFFFEQLPHFAYHAMHPLDALSTADNVLSIGGLLGMAALAAICLIAMSWRPSITASDRRVVEEVAA